MLYALSKIVPVLMRSTYGYSSSEGEGRETCTWIQWRGRCLVLSRVPVAG